MIEHDLFGLAAVIFFLLHGVHPFSGQWNGRSEPPTTDMNIKCGRWTYGDDGDLSPSPHALPMNILHPELQSLFHRCFSEGMHSPRSRPTCREWIEALHRATTQLKPCDKVSTHCYDATQNRDCPFCAYRRRTGYELFNAHRPKKKIRKKRTKPPAPKNPSSSSSSMRIPFLRHFSQTFINNGTDWQARLKTPSLPRPPGQFSRLGKHPMHGFLWQPSSSKQPMTDYMQYLSDLLKNL